jgi:putative transcriptional regulator
MASDEILPARGTLLVARPHLLDPNFAHTVVLLCDHDDGEGTLGFVLNRPSENRLPDVLRGDHAFPGRSDRVYLGGPVGLDSLAVMHREEGLDGAVEVLPGVYLGGAPPEIGERVRLHATPEGSIRFLVGYSGWGKGQLAREMEEETWVVAPASPAWVFDPAPETLWRRVLRSLGGACSTMANMPRDPESN